jgi:hypothetical protein
MSPARSAGADDRPETRLTAATAGSTTSPRRLHASAWKVAFDGPMPRIRITWEKIRVHRSEFYGLIAGEPGESAEWSLSLLGFANGETDDKKWKDEAYWTHDEVRDNTTYEVDQFMEFDSDGPVRVRFAGKERDDIADDDELPTVDFTHDPDPRWANGPVRYKKKRSKGGAFSYTVHYTIEHVEKFGGVVVPGHGVLFDTRYSGLWDENRERVVASIGQTADELQRQASKLWPQGGRLAQLQPYVQGSEVLYNAIWNFSAIRQLWNINCDEQHFVDTTGETWSWARPHQVVPFVVDGQLRYAVLWNEGQHSQRWHHNTDEAGFRAITGGTWGWARPHQVYAFTHGGQVRYSCLWNRGQQSVLWHPNCSEEEAYKLGGDNWGWGRAHQMQPFMVNGQRRFSVLWQQGQYGQLWNLNCDGRQVAANTSDVEDWGRPRQLYATVPQA